MPKQATRYLPLPSNPLQTSLVNTRVLVIGAGVSGLSTAWYLQKKGYEVHVVEKEKDCGGVLASSAHKGAIIEWGPGSFRVREPLFMDLLQDLNLQDSIVELNEQVRMLWIEQNGRLTRLGPQYLLRSVLSSPTTVLRLLSGPLRTTSFALDISLLDLVNQQLGPAFLPVAQAFCSGAYSADIRQLSARFVLGDLFEKTQQAGSIVRALLAVRKIAKKQAAAMPAKSLWLRGGNQQLTQRLAAQMDNLHLGTEISLIHQDDHWQAIDNTSASLGEFSHVVFATPYAACCKILGAVHPGALPPALAVPDGPLRVIACGFPDNMQQANKSPLPGFGLVTASPNTTKIWGAQCNSNTVPQRSCTAQHLVTIYAPAALTATQAIEQYTKLVQAPNPEWFAEKKLAHAIPAPGPQFAAITTALDALQKQFAGLHFASNWLGNVGVPKRVVVAQKTAQTIHQQDQAK